MHLLYNTHAALFLFLFLHSGQINLKFSSHFKVKPTISIKWMMPQSLIFCFFFSQFSLKFLFLCNYGISRNFNIKFIISNLIFYVRRAENQNLNDFEIMYILRSFLTTPILATIKYRENQTCKTKLKTHLAFFWKSTTTSWPYFKT